MSSNIKPRKKYVAQHLVILFIVLQISIKHTHTHTPTPTHTHIQTGLFYIQTKDPIVCPKVEIMKPNP